jgi:hypothetical protein
MSGARAVVFLGPSVDSAVARGRFDAEFRPAAGYGDIDALLAEEQPPEVIGIVDGVLAPSRSVQPKEVIRALDRGIAVFGSSGVGALRAVECGRYGMIGVGRIFEEFQAGRIDADDEVVRAGEPLSEPLVNMRFAVAAAVAAGATTARTAKRFVDIAKALHFPQRTIASVMRGLAAEVDPASCATLHQFLTLEAPDTARDDAIALLDAIQAT